MGKAARGMRLQLNNTSQWCRNLGLYQTGQVPPGGDSAHSEPPFQELIAYANSPQLFDNVVFWNVTGKDFRLQSGVMNLGAFGNNSLLLEWNYPSEESQSTGMTRLSSRY